MRNWSASRSLALSTRMSCKSLGSESNFDLLMVRMDVSTARFTSDRCLTTSYKLRPIPVIEGRSEEHTSELQSLMRISYAVFCLKKNSTNKHNITRKTHSNR